MKNRVSLAKAGADQALVDRAAGYTLAHIAESGRLFETMKSVGLVDDAGTIVNTLGSSPVPNALSALLDGDDSLKPLEQVLGKSAIQCRENVWHRLLEVASFVEADGGSTEDNIKAVEYLIRSGRGSMFSKG